MKHDPVTVISPNNQRSSWLERLSQVLLREPQDRKQLIELLRDAETRDLLDSDALQMIEGVLQVSEMQVRDIMIPRPQMVTIDINASLETFLPIVIESAHSRFPVLNDHDEVIGILLAKDLLAFTLNSSGFNCREKMRPVLFVPESKRLDVLLKEFRQNRNHMAIVVDEYGHTDGLVTIEDVLEQIVGNIEDEYDIEEDHNIHHHGQSKYTIQAFTSIEEFNHYFNTGFSNDEYDTIGGLVTQQFGHLPKPNETIVINQFEFRILKADNRRIHLLQVLQQTPVVKQNVDVSC